MTSQKSSAGQVLMVCTGNICRSPLAESLWAREFDSTASLSALGVSSAGLSAVVGAGMDPQVSAIAQRLGARSQHTARQLDDSIVRESDLIITMTSEQLDLLLRRHPTALRRSFTLTGVSRLVAGAEPGLPGLEDGLRPLAQALARKRSSIRLTAQDDIEDPYRKDEATHERVAAQIEQLITPLARTFQRLEAQTSGAR